MVDFAPGPRRSERTKSLEELPGFQRFEGSSKLPATQSLNQVGYSTRDFPTHSLLGYFNDDHFQGIWNVTTRYFDEIRSGDLLNPKVRTAGVASLDSQKRLVDPFDSLGITEPVSATCPEQTNGYVMYFGRERLPTVFIGAGLSRREDIEQVHAVAITAYHVSLPQGEDVAIKAAREASCNECRELGLVYRISF